VDIVGTHNNNSTSTINYSKIKKPWLLSDLPSNDQELAYNEQIYWLGSFDDK
jgi:hypothetical protein